MQRVVRSALVGLLTLAGLTACGDKVTVPPVTTTPPDLTIKGVTVSPPSATIAVGSKIILAASVDAGSGVTDRTVTWSSSDNTVATVGTDGTVTGVKAGTVTITAASHADPTQKGASVVTVGGPIGGPVTVTISSMNQTVCGIGGCNSVPANLAAVAGQLDVILNVDAGGQALKTVQATLTCGKQTMTRSQTVGAAAASATDAEAAQATVTLSFPTNEFNPTTGAPTLLNGPCTISASATTASGTQSATNSQQFTLANQDAVIVNTTTNGNTASDVNGFPWKSGAVTVSALPVIYSGRTVSSVQITLPGASGPTQLVPAVAGGATTATWANSTSGSVANKVGQLTLSGVDANGFPIGVHPTVLVIDNAGNDLQLVQANSTQQSDIRVDNQSPEAPQTFQIPQSQGQWVNGSYTFTGAGVNAGTDAKYVSCGDGPTTAAGVPQPACNPQVGVSAAPVSGNTGLNGQTTVTFYAIAAGSYPGISASGTSTSSSTCDVTGWTKIATAGDLAETTTNTAYVVRAVETDKLGNLRCTDISTNVNTINTGAGTYVTAKFGVDKTAPTAAYIDPSTDATAAGDKSVYGIGSATPFFKLAVSDNASGFSATPVVTKLTRLAIDPSTGAASTTTNAFGCPIVFSNNSCTTARKGVTLQADNGSGIDGYYTYTPIVTDLAQNQTPLAARTIVIDRQAPVMGGIAVPATINGGQSASFATSATDNLDLINTDYTLTYNVAVGGNAAPFNIRTPGPTLGTAFDNVLTTAASFSLNVPSFIRTVASVDVNGAPQNNGAVANNITVRAYDAAGNVSNPGSAAINPANVNQTNPTNYTALQSNGAQFLAFGVTTPATAVSDCAPGKCNGNGGNPVNPTSVNLTASAIGTEGGNFQFLNPFTQVQFYYLNANTGEWTLAGSTTAPVVTDNTTATQRTFTWTFNFAPPAGLPTGPLKVIAVGVNGSGDALATNASTTVTLTNP